MFYEKKKEIRKYVRSLEWTDTMRLMVETQAQIKELMTTMSWIEGLDGIKKHIKKSIDLELAGYKLEYCAKRIQCMARIEQSKWAHEFRESVLKT